MKATFAKDAVALGLLDFREAFMESPEEAVMQFERLLTDEASCRARIAFLQALAVDSSVQSEAHSADIQEAMDFTCTVGVMRAYREGLLRQNHVESLHRLTCQPEALWQTHERLVNPDKQEAVDETTSIDEETSRDNV